MRSIWLAAALAIAVSATGASAQKKSTVVGFVRDSAGRPIQGVEVRTPSAGKPSVTDATGRFQFANVGDDMVRLRFRKVGLEPVNLATVRDSASESSPVAVTMGPMIARLGRVVVEGQAYDQKLWENGFYERQRASRGTFFDPADIEFYAHAGLGAIVQQAERVRVETRGTQQFAFGDVAGRRCVMHVYVDGVYQYSAIPKNNNAATAVGLREIVDPRNIYAVEVYPSATGVPTQYQRMGSADGNNAARMPSPGEAWREAAASSDPNAPCGAILIWKRPAYEDRKQSTKPKPKSSADSTSRP